MADPIRRLRLPLKDRPAFYWVIIGFTVTLIAFVMVVTRQNHESTTRTKQLQDVICGVYVPIAQAHVNGVNSALGRTIVVATRHGALELHCPGVK
jgi:membrane glycosyltransferase